MRAVSILLRDDLRARAAPAAIFVVDVLVLLARVAHALPAGAAGGRAHQLHAPVTCHLQDPRVTFGYRPRLRVTLLAANVAPALERRHWTYTPVSLPGLRRARSDHDGWGSAAGVAMPHFEPAWPWMPISSREEDSHHGAWRDIIRRCGEHPTPVATAGTHLHAKSLKCAALDVANRLLSAAAPALGRRTPNPTRPPYKETQRHRQREKEGHTHTHTHKHRQRDKQAPAHTHTGT